MSTGNPLEQLRRRMQSHATPTAFAALAEEHRRAGRLAEAIAVCRDGLERYPGLRLGAGDARTRAARQRRRRPAAVTELEHAVAQSPDNLAAARALESARAALGDVPWPPVPVAAVDADDLPLRAPDGQTVSIAPSLIADARAAGQAGPQEFDPAGSDWSVPDTLPPLPVTEAPALDDDWQTGSSYAQTGSPTIDVPPTNRQDEDPSGVWQAPAAPSNASPDATDGAFEFSWFLDPPSSAMLDEQVVAERFGPDESELPGVSDARAIEATVAEVAAPDDDAIAAAAEDVPVVADGVLDVPIDDESSSFWAGSYGGEPVTDAPAPFAGWGEDGPARFEKTDQSAWADEGVADATGTWTTPDGPSAAWALGDLEADGADPTPFQGTLDVEDTRPRPFAGITETSDWADTAVATSPASLTESSLEAVASSPAAIDEGVTLLLEASEEAPEPWLAEWTDSTVESLQAAPLEETSEPRGGDTPDEASVPLLWDGPPTP